MSEENLRRQKRKKFLEEFSDVAFFTSSFLTAIWMIDPYLDVWGHDFFIVPFVSWCGFFCFWIAYRSRKAERKIRRRRSLRTTINFLSSIGLLFGGIFCALAAIGCICQCIINRFPSDWDTPFWYAINPVTVKAFWISLRVFIVCIFVTIFLHRGDSGIL